MKAMLMAFDVPYLYFRSFFGVPASTSPLTGRPVNAVRGTLDAVARLVQQYQPSHVAMAWDADWRPQWRVDLVPSYKTHRLASDETEEVPDELNLQVPMIADVFTALGLRNIGIAHHEADDVLGSFARQWPEDVLVVTGDRDLFQLADQSTRVVYIGKGVAKHELVDPAWLEGTYDVPAGRYLDFSVLRGDPSDGLPGVKGVGEKTAARLVRDFPSLSAMLDAAQTATDLSPAVAKKLVAAAEYLPPAAKVVQVVTHLDVGQPDALPLAPVEAEDRWGLGGSWRRAVAALTHAADTPPS